MTDWRRRRDEERRRAEPYPNIAAGMAVAPSRTRPLTGSEDDAWQYDLAVSPLWDPMQATVRPPLRCWYCTGDHYTDRCEEAR